MPFTHHQGYRRWHQWCQGRWTLHGASPTSLYFANAASSCPSCAIWLPCSLAWTEMTSVYDTPTPHTICSISAASLGVATWPTRTGSAGRSPLCSWMTTFGPLPHPPAGSHIKGDVHVGEAATARWHDFYPKTMLRNSLLGGAPYQGIRHQSPGSVVLRGLERIWVSGQGK